jgi:hypothetical protein
MIYRAALPYVVPSPRGKSAGIARDGRLHFVMLTTTPDGVNQPVVGLEYLDPTGRRMALFIDGQTYNSAPGAASVLSAWGTEPMPVSANFNAVGASGTYYGGASAPGGFKWLPAGSTARIFTDGPTVSVTNVWVEDYAGLAEGDEYTGGQPRTELPQLLLREA